MFALIEIPLVCYLFAPDRSAAAVERFAAWTHAKHARDRRLGRRDLGAYLVISGVVDLV